MSVSSVVSYTTRTPQVAKWEISQLLKIIILDMYIVLDGWVPFADKQGRRRRSLGACLP